MKRNLELIRTILLEIEKHDQADGSISQFDIPDYTKEQIIYHLNLLKDHGFIHGTMPAGGFYNINTKLSWEAHEFIDLSRNDNVWNKAMERTKSVLGTAGDISIKVLSALLIQLAKDMLLGG